MPQDNQPNWMDEEENRAEVQAITGRTTNEKAPQLIRVEKAPERKQKAFYIQPLYAEAFEDFALKQKRVGGSKATELAEEMIKDLLNKYGQDTSEL